jgi:hypothetical protein
MNHEKGIVALRPNFEVITFSFSGKLSVDSDHLNPSHNNNNHKWPSSCANLLQSSINCINNEEKLANNNNTKPPNNHTMSLNHQREISLGNHHHQHNIYSSPFSSLPYLLDPLGNLQKSAASNNLF